MVSNSNKIKLKSVIEDDIFFVKISGRSLKEALVVNSSLFVKSVP